MCRFTPIVSDSNFTNSILFYASVNAGVIQTDFSMTVIATWDLYASRNSEDRIAIEASVYLPELDPRSSNDNYRTKIEITGILGPKYVCGVNSMQSLVLAMRLLRFHVEMASEANWKFYFDSESTDQFDLADAILPEPL